MFFRPAILALQKQNHHIICTSRKYREVDELSKIFKLNLLVVGSHGGSDLYDKLYQSTRRTMELTKIAHDFSPDLAISFSSPEATRVSFGLGVKHIGFNDSPHAEAVAKLTIPLLTKLFSPSMIPFSAWKRYGISSNQVIYYDGLDPIAWLSRDNDDDRQRLPEKAKYMKEKDIGFLTKLNIDVSKKSILVRLEESKASYISNKKLQLQPIELVDFIVKSFGTRCNVIILCRYSDQINEISKRYENKAIVLKQVVDGVKLLHSIDIFVGAGGTMTAEAALLGKPTISIAPIQFYIDDYLKKMSLIVRAFTTVQLEKFLNSFLEDEKKCLVLKEHASKVLNKMEDPIEKLVSYISQISKNNS